MINDELLRILACPVCRKEVVLENEKIVCKTCRKKYPVKDGIPVMIPEEAEDYER